jgi:hypothetical protein
MRKFTVRNFSLRADFRMNVAAASLFNLELNACRC